MKAHTHWLLQRITAIIFTISLIIFIPLYATTPYYLLSYNTFMFSVIAISLIALWHSSLGIQTICEDYIHNTRTRKTLLLLINIIFISSYIIGFAALLCLMVL